MHWKMTESWPTFVCNFNESVQYSTKVFSVINFPFEQNSISLCLAYDRNLSLHENITVTYFKLEFFNSIHFEPLIKAASDILVLRYDIANL